MKTWFLLTCIQIIALAAILGSSMERRNYALACTAAAGAAYYTVSLLNRLQTIMKDLKDKTQED